MDFLATGKIPLLSSLMSIASRYIREMRDSPFTKGGGTKNFRSKNHLGVLLYHLYIWTMLVRVVCTAVTLNTGGALLPGYLAHVDLLMAFFLRVHFIDGHLAMIGWPSIILGAVLDLTARFIRQTYCYRLVFDLLITNKQNFFYLNPQLVVRGWRGVPNLYRKLVQKYDEAEKSAVLVLGCHKLLYFPYLNRSVRLRAVALSFTFDLITAVTSAVFGLEALVTVLYYTLKYFRFWYDSLLQQVVITLDLAMMSYMVWHSIQISFFLIHGVYLVLYVHVAQQRSLNRLLDSFTVKMMRKKEEEEKLMMLTNLLTSSSSHSTSITAGTTMKRAIETLDSRRRRGSSQNQISGSINRNSNHHNIGSYFLLPSYLRSHLRFTRDLLKTNRELFSPLLFLTLVTLFAGNVYSVTMIVLSRQHSFMENSLLLLISGLSSFFLLVTVRPEVIAASTLASASKHLYRAQSYLSCQSSGNGSISTSFSLGADVRLKMKVATYFEVLNSGEKFAYTVGPIGKVTNESIAQFCFFYTSYLMFSINLSFSTL